MLVEQLNEKNKSMKHFIVGVLCRPLTRSNGETHSQKYLNVSRAIKQKYEEFCCWCPVSSTYTFEWGVIKVLLILVFLLHLQITIMVLLLLSFLRCIGEFDAWPSIIIKITHC